MENIWLKELSLDDGMDFYNLLDELKNYPDVYARPVPQDFSVSDFDDFKRLRIRMRNNDNLPSYVVPTTTYWVMCGEIPIGYGTIRHRILEGKPGGHFGLCLKKEFQNRGIGTIVANLMSEIAYYDLGIEEVIYTSKSENEQSKQSVQNIGGTFLYEKDGYCFYSVNLKEKFKGEVRNDRY